MPVIASPSLRGRGNPEVYSKKERMITSLSDNRNDELLQSDAWMRFQEAAGRCVVRLCGSDWSANGIVHTLPIVGKYLYVPRGPRTMNSEQITGSRDEFRNDKKSSDSNDRKGMESGVGLKRTPESLIVEAKEKRVGWIRIEPESEETFSAIRNAVSGVRIVKAPHDMQPRETFVVDLSPSEEELFAGMKPKTRYNVRVAGKRGVNVVVSTERRYVDAFIRLVTGTADRKGIVPHPKGYYEAMCEALLGENGKIFAGEKDGEIIAANLVVFHGDTATYLHGGSDDRFRADMAPFLLQWEAMREAKRRGCAWYDFGGVNMAELEAGKGKWLGITRFKVGFSPTTPVTAFPGSYDIVLSPVRYGAYRMIQKLKVSLR